MEEPAASRLDALGTVAVKMVTAASAVIREALDPHDPPSPRFFLLDLALQLDEFDRLFAGKAAVWTQAALKVGTVPITRFGFSATSGHGMARQIAGEVLDAGRNLIPPLQKREFDRAWQRAIIRLKPLRSVDGEWVIAQIIAEQDVCGEADPTSHRQQPADIRPVAREPAIEAHEQSAGYLSLRLDETRHVVSRDGHSPLCLAHSPLRFALLAKLIRNRDAPTSRDALAPIWKEHGTDDSPSDERIDGEISKLRREVSGLGLTIGNQRRIGWLLKEKSPA